MALRQYAAKVATPHPLRGSSPLGEPKSFGGAVCHCRGIGGGQPSNARYRKWRGPFRFLLGLQKEHLKSRTPLNRVKRRMVARNGSGNLKRRKNNLLYSFRDYGILALYVLAKVH